MKDAKSENVDETHDDVQSDDHKVSEPAQKHQETEDSKKKGVKVPKSKYSVEMKKEAVELALKYNKKSRAADEIKKKYDLKTLDESSIRELIQNNHELIVKKNALNVE